MRGRLRIYLGAAPGVGKTYKMLEEAHRRVGRGADVVVALVETHGRKNTQALLEGLEIFAPLIRAYRDRTFNEMDLDAVLARHPQVALVDGITMVLSLPAATQAKLPAADEELLA